MITLILFVEVFFISIIPKYAISHVKLAQIIPTQHVHLVILLYLDLLTRRHVCVKQAILKMVKPYVEVLIF